MSYIKLYNDNEPTFYKVNNNLEIIYGPRYSFKEINSLFKVKKIKNVNYDCGHCQTQLKYNNWYRELKCGCKFHIKCIDLWINNDQNDCPKCLKDIIYNE